ncbi:TonB-dependent receptor plug domain-containing protein [Cellvibrio sp.]|uniref:TonB-dependent receptor plug domain-containing protein n=1 Tax=Cellvibrio sp. TaxID=1965322 RepID=UPI0039648504
MNAPAMKASVIKASVMKAPYRRALLPALVCAISATTHAENKSAAPLDVYNLSLAELGQVQISIATGNSTSLEKAPATASVIYAAEIEAMGARNLDEILETVPGLHVGLSALSRLDSVYSIRGIHTGFNSQVLLLLNGVPVQSTLQGGHPTMFRLPVSSIARVEVMRGPGSAIYGADAYAGVINVITKDAAAIDAPQMSVRTGSFGYREASLQGASNWQGLGVALDMSYQESDGDPSRRVEADFQSSLDASLKTKASLAPGHLSTRYHVWDTHLALSSEHWRINLWNWLSKDAGVGAGAAQALDMDGYDDNHLIMGDATYQFGADSGNWDNSVRLSHLFSDHTTKFNLLPPGVKVPIGSDGNINFAKPSGLVTFPEGLKGHPGQTTNDTQLELVSIYNGFESHRIRFSVGSRRQSFEGSEQKNFGPGVIDGTQPVVSGALTDVTGTPFVYLNDGSRNVSFLSLQDEWKLNKDLTLTSGVRYDKYSDFGGTTNPRLALVYALNENLTTKLLFGSAFRAPSISELYFKNNPVSLGNPDLNPETINTIEWSFNYRFNPNLQTTLTLFRYQSKDMIEFLADANGVTKTAQNARDQDGHGYELEVSWKPLSQFRMGTSYSFNNPTDAKTGATVPDAPGRQLKLNADWEFTKNWFFNTQVELVADRVRAPIDNRPEIQDYTWVNFTLRAKDLFQDLDLSLAVRNAANANAREPSSGRIARDYPLESRSGWVEFKYSFK